jgi:hypothetical protein
VFTAIGRLIDRIISLAIKLTVVVVGTLIIGGLLGVSRASRPKRASGGQRSSSHD